MVYRCSCGSHSGNRQMCIRDRIYPERSKTTISACSFSLRIRAAAVAPPATPPTMTTFILSFYLSCISRNSAYVFHVGITQLLQNSSCLAASCTTETVHKDGGSFIVNHASHFVNGLQRNIFTAGDKMCIRDRPFQFSFILNCLF